jgi:hypothetical protein
MTSRGRERWVGRTPMPSLSRTYYESQSIEEVFLRRQMQHIAVAMDKSPILHSDASSAQQQHYHQQRRPPTAPEPRGLGGAGLSPIDACAAAEASGGLAQRPRTVAPIHGSSVSVRTLQRMSATSSSRRPSSQQLSRAPTAQGSTTGHAVPLMPAATRALFASNSTDLVSTWSGAEQPPRPRALAQGSGHGGRRCGERLGCGQRSDVWCRLGGAGAGASERAVASRGAERSPRPSCPSPSHQPGCRLRRRQLQLALRAATGRRSHGRAHRRETSRRQPSPEFRQCRRHRHRQHPRRWCNRHHRCWCSRHGRCRWLWRCRWRSRCCSLLPSLSSREAGASAS